MARASVTVVDAQVARWAGPEAATAATVGRTAAGVVAPRFAADVLGVAVSGRARAGDAAAYRLARAGLLAFRLPVAAGLILRIA